VVAPLLSGILVYMLVLMFFDSVDMLAENFFSREVVFVVGLTLIFFETNRLIIVILNRIYPIDRNIKLRIFIQYAFSVTITLSVISLVLYFYFSLVEGFSTIRTELITFNSIYIFAAVFYHLYFFSLYILYKKNEDRVKQELHKRESIQFELDSFKNRVNPAFLFHSLEIIIAELYRNKKHADELVGKLAKSYRYTLDNSHKELVPLQDEMETLKMILPVYEKLHFNAIKLSIPLNHKKDVYIIPGTLQIILEHTLMGSIITEALPLEYNIAIEDKTLEIRYAEHKKITHDNIPVSRFEMLEKAYHYYSETGIQSRIKDGLRIIELPLLEIEEE
jgi:hypothetical protein